MQKLALVLLLEGGQDVEVITVRSQVSFVGLRGYVRELRKERGVSQPKLAEAIGMQPRTYKAWELGTTETIKTHYVLRAVRFLKGSFDQLAEIDDDTTAEEGAAMAKDWLTREAVAAELTPRPDDTPDVVERLNRLIALLARSASPAEIERLMQDEQ